jgi:hypothetical protein
MLFILDKIPELRSLMPVELWLIVSDFQKANFKKRLQQTNLLETYPLRSRYAQSKEFTRGKPNFCWEEPGEVVFLHVQRSSEQIIIYQSVNRIRWVLCYEARELRSWEMSVNWWNGNQDTVCFELWKGVETRHNYSVK